MYACMYVCMYVCMYACMYAVCSMQYACIHTSACGQAMVRRDRALEQRHEVLQAAMADLSRATRCSKVSAGTHAGRQTDADRERERERERERDR